VEDASKTIRQVDVHARESTALDKKAREPGKRSPIEAEVPRVIGLILDMRVTRATKLIFTLIFNAINLSVELGY